MDPRPPPPPSLLYPGCFFCRTHTTSSNSCYLTATRCRRVQLFSIGSGPGGSGWRHAEIKTGYSCYLTAACRRLGCFFSLVDLGPGATVGGSRIEINIGLSCYLICNDSWRRMALQPNAEFNSYYLFSIILVFVSRCLSLSLSFSMYLSLYLSNLSLLWLPKHFPKVAATDSTTCGLGFYGGKGVYLP